MSAGPAAIIDTWAAVMASSLWRASWEGGAALLLAGAVCRVFRALSPRVRCWLWRLAYLKLLAALVWITPVRLPLLATPRPAVETTTTMASTRQPRVGDRPAPRARPLGQPRDRGPSRGANPGVIAAAPHVPRPAPRPTPRDGSLSADAWLLLLWIGGAAVAGQKVAREWRASRRLAAGASPVAEERLRELYVALCRCFRLRRCPRVLLCGAVDSPVLVGTWPPAILVPPALLQSCGGEDLRSILAHELAHVKRHDLLWSWLPALAQVAFFFHPLVWLAQREWRLAQEIGCDELAMEAAQLRPPEYGQVILKVAARHRPDHRAVPAAVGAAGSYESLSRRLTALCRIRPMSSRRWRVVSALLGAAGVGVIVPWRVVARVVPPTPLRYEAIIEQQDGAETRWARIVYDQGRFRVEHFSHPGDRTPEWIELYNGNERGLVWDYRPETHQAGPTLFSMLGGLARARNRLRAARGKALHVVPPAGIVPCRRTGPSPTLRPVTLADLTAMSPRQVGRGEAWGIACDLYEGCFVPAGHDRLLQAGSLIEASAGYRFRAWVEPRTLLVLRLKRELRYPRAAPIPPRRQVFLLRRLRLTNEVPASQFRLPPFTVTGPPVASRPARPPHGMKDAAGLGLRERPAGGQQGRRLG